MNRIDDRLNAMSAARLLGMRRGLEKESLRVGPTGTLALTPHPTALGAPLTHPNITTDFCESQVEMVTGVHASVAACERELLEVHQFVARGLQGPDLAGPAAERLWVGSMPCGLPADETIPIGRYGTSHIGRAKSVYRMGLGHRYGRRMQTISGIHYNWSVPGMSNDEAFALIRNFRRHSFLLLWLFGASPALCSSFVQGREHGLQALSKGSLHLPHATSLRMGRLGYQSDAQANINVSYNGLEPYASGLEAAMTQPYPAYEQLGVRNPGGEYNQLATTLLQIENEFYGTIRPKRVIRSGERPLHALRERGVEYVEVRCMDLNPFLTVGIDAPTMHMLDVFLLHAMLADSPPDTPEEMAALARNQQRTASAGREPGLRLERGQREITLLEWAQELLAQMQPVAQVLDEVHLAKASAEGHIQAAGDEPHLAQPHSHALKQAQAALQTPNGLPSARVLQAIQAQHANSYTAFINTQSALAQQALLALPWSHAQQGHHAQMAAQSLARLKAIEAADVGDFETWRLAYLDPLMLKP